MNKVLFRANPANTLASLPFLRALAIPRPVRLPWVALVLFLASGALAHAALTVVGTSPANGTTNVSIGTVVTATFNEAIDPSTLTAANFALQTAANTAVPGTIS